MRKMTAPLLLLFFISVGVFTVSFTSTVHAISVDATLSGQNLSSSNPINFTVNFGTSFSTIDVLILTGYWVDDGLDEGEAITYFNLGGYLQTLGSGTVFSRELHFSPAFHPEVVNEFLDGFYNGTIFAQSYDVSLVPPQASFPNTATATFDRLVFTIEGNVSQVPEPATVLLFGTGMAGLIALRRTFTAYRL